MPYIHLSDGRIVFSPLIIEGEGEGWLPNPLGESTFEPAAGLLERLARIEQALRVPPNTGGMEREAVRVATDATPTDDELPHTEWRKFKDRIWKAARQQREADWPNLSSTAKQKLGTIAGGMAKSLAQEPAKLDELAANLVETFDRMLAEEQGQTSAPARPSSPTSEDQQRLIEQEAQENERRQLIQQVAARAAQQLGCAEADLLEAAKTALETTDGHTDRAVEFLLDERQVVPDVQTLANDQGAITEMIAQALGYVSYKSARRQHEAIDRLAGDFAGRADNERTEEALQTAIEEALQAETLRECSR